MCVSCPSWGHQMKQTQHDCPLSVHGLLQLLGIQKYCSIIQPFWCPSVSLCSTVTFQSSLLLSPEAVYFTTAIKRERERGHCRADPLQPDPSDLHRRVMTVVNVIDHEPATNQSDGLSTMEEVEEYFLWERMVCHATRKCLASSSDVWVKSLGKPSQKKSHITTYVLW